MQNFGPSIISNFHFQLQIPSNYTKKLNFINRTEIVIKAKYDNRDLEPVWDRFHDEIQEDDVMDFNVLNGDSKRRKRKIDDDNSTKPEDLPSIIPANRTIYLNCSNSNQCENIEFHIYDFEAGNKIATIELEIFINHVKLCKLFVICFCIKYFKFITFQLTRLDSWFFQ